ITPPVLLPGCPSPIDLSIEVDIDPAGMPVAEVASSLHPIAVEDLEGERFRVRVHPGERTDRDFIMRLRLGDDRAISSTLVVVPDATTTAGTNVNVNVKEGDGTFALTLLPPALSDSTRARDVVFVLDRSGSMAGWKMVTARRATARMLDTLTGADRFAVLAFDHDVETPTDLSESLAPATDRNRFRAVEFLAGLEARGGTEMLAPLVRGADLLSSAAAGEVSAHGDAAHPTAEAEPRAETRTESGPLRDPILVLVTDGQVGNEDQILATLAPRLAGVRIHTVGIDVAVNDAFLRRIAAIGGGHCELVESEDRLDAAMEAIHRRVGSPLVTDLALEAAGLDILPGSLTPSPLPGLYAGAALQLAGRYRGQAQGAVTVTGRAAGGSAWSAELPSVRSDNTGLTGIWARGRLRDLEDRYVIGTGPFGDADRDAKALERQIVAMSLRFGVLCRFTAYVAIDSRVVNESGAQRHVTQPVDLPQGWELGRPAPAGPAASGRRMLAAGSAPAFARAAYNAQSRGIPAASGQMPATFGGSAFARAPGSPLQGSLHEAEVDVPVPGAALTAAQFEQLGAVRTSLSEEFARLESVGAADRPGQLRDLAERLADLLADVDVPDDLGGLQPLRDLARDLHAFGQLAEPDPVEVDRLWLRVVDVLSAWAGGAGDLWSVFRAPPTGLPRDGRPAGDCPVPDAGSTNRSKRAFWRRAR
ncbi:MAG TPA: VWA domain-containing protein, partial [Actinopolymorphaceae bacterium]|nr:VWA domain-containing protein [Actinopolymorphaceae bacterium]